MIAGGPWPGGPLSGYATDTNLLTIINLIMYKDVYNRVIILKLLDLISAFLSMNEKKEMLYIK